MRDGERDNLEPNNAAALEVVCLVVLDHEGQVVEDEAAPVLLLVSHREAMGRLAA